MNNSGPRDFWERDPATVLRPDGGPSGSEPAQPQGRPSAQASHPPAGPHAPTEPRPVRGFGGPYTVAEAPGAFNTSGAVAAPDTVGTSGAFSTPGTPGAPSAPEAFGAHGTPGAFGTPDPYGAPGATGAQVAPPATYPADAVPDALDLPPWAPQPSGPPPRVGGAVAALAVAFLTWTVPVIGIALGLWFYVLVANLPGVAFAVIALTKVPDTDAVERFIRYTWVCNFSYAVLSVLFAFPLAAVAMMMFLFGG